MIARGSRKFFAPFSNLSAGAPKGIQYHTLPDGAFYVRFFESFEYWISKNGRQVFCRNIRSRKKKSGSAPDLAPIIFLQTNILSFSLLGIGFETFHASAVVIDGKAVAFLGESGYGKSTLAASFLRNGFSLLTDDVLAVHQKRGKFLTASGASQIKLLPQAAKSILPDAPTALAMNPVSHKLILRLAHEKLEPAPCEVGAFYILWPRFKTARSEIRIQKLKFRDAVISIIKSSHNLIVQKKGRLQKQMAVTSDLAKRVPVRAISYPRDFRRIPYLREKILKDLRRIL